MGLQQGRVPGRQGPGFDGRRMQGRLQPLPAATGRAGLAEGLQLAAQGADHIPARHDAKKLLAAGQAGAEGGAAIAIEQAGAIDHPAGPADAALTGVGLEPEVQAIAIGLADHRQAVVGLAALQRIDAPTGPLLERPTGRQRPDHQDQAQTAGAGLAPDQAGRPGEWSGGRARGANEVVHPQQADQGQR